MKRLNRVLGAGGFSREPIPHGDRDVMAYVMRCSCEGCTTTDHVRIASANPDRNTPDLIAKRFKLLGWMVGRDRDDDMCPTCSGVGRSKREDPPVKEHPQLVAMAKNEERRAVDRASYTPTDDQARVLNIAPTREDRRRIMAELHSHYDPAAQRYNGAASDANIAIVLSMPRAWVAEVREDFFGPDKNEADAERQAAIERLTDRLDDAASALEKAIEELADIRSQLDALKAGG
jgi:hypothetical protein